MAFVLKAQSIPRKDDNAFANINHEISKLLASSSEHVTCNLFDNVWGVPRGQRSKGKASRALCLFATDTL
jgi:hypothetical protein